MIQTTHHNQTKQMHQQRQHQSQHRYQSQEPQESHQEDHSGSKNQAKSITPVSSVTIRNTRRSKSTPSTTSKSRQSKKPQLRKKVTGNTTAKRVRIITEQDEEEESNEVNLVSNNEINEKDAYFFTLNENSINRIYQAMKPEENILLNLYTLELMSDPETPNTIRQALNGKDKELWRKSAIAEVNNFLKRKSWKFISKNIEIAFGRKLI